MKVLIIQNRALFDSEGKTDFKQKNFENILNLTQKVKGQTFDLIVLPELFSTGWYPPIYPKSFETEDNSSTMKFLSILAKDFNSNVVGGSFVLKTKNGLKNTCPVFDRNGKLVAKYEKMHLFSHYLQAANKFRLQNHLSSLWTHRR